MRKLSIIFLLLLFAQTSSCGLLLYPERQGQTGGRIDPGVAVLDAIGLLFYIVPGLVAFGVDFITGTIYVPGTQASNLDPASIREIKVADGSLTPERAAAIVAEQTGQPIDLSSPDMQVVAFADRNALLAALSEAGAEHAHPR